MFAELMPLLASRSVCIMASRIDDQTIRVIVLPKRGKEGRALHLARRYPLTEPRRNSTLNSVHSWRLM
jgi:hypothetical protein